MLSFKFANKNDPLSLFFSLILGTCAKTLKKERKSLEILYKKSIFPNTKIVLMLAKHKNKKNEKYHNCC